MLDFLKKKVYLDVTYSLKILEVLKPKEDNKELLKTNQFKDIKNSWSSSKNNSGWENFKQCIKSEIEYIPNSKKQYHTLSDPLKKEFWKKVDYISGLMG